MKRKLLLALALLGLLVLPVYAQFGFGGGTGLLLFHKSVQNELKLTDAQKADLKKVSDKMNADMAKGREAFMEGDFKTGQEIFKKARETAAKGITKYKEKLTPAQAKRLGQIELQVDARATGLKIFQQERVTKALKLTDKQKDALTGAIKDADADIKGITDDIPKGDFRAMFAAQKKIATIHQKAVAKFQKDLTEQQKSAWKELTGAPFELKLDFPKKGKGKRDDT
jgi:hypothetical protein